MLWTGTLAELEVFEKSINEIHHSIKLTFEHSYEEINFLDTTITISSNGRLENFQKTNRQIQLPPQLFIPPKFFKKQHPLRPSPQVKKDMHQ